MLNVKAIINIKIVQNVQILLNPTKYANSNLLTKKTDNRICTVTFVHGAMNHLSVLILFCLTTGYLISKCDK